MTLRMVRPLSLALLVSLGMDGAATAESVVKTVTTTLTLDACEQSGNIEDGGIWICGGLGGTRVYVAEGDLRQFVSFGDMAEDAPAAQQTLPSFNSMFPPDSQTAEIHWRVESKGGAETPFSAIVRFFTSAEADDGTVKPGEVLVIIRLATADAAGVCHVGYVDVPANAAAMSVAEAAADADARAFDCSNSQPKVYGATEDGSTLPAAE